MRSLRKLFGASIACAFGFATLFAAGAAESPRAAVNANRSLSTVHMPTMPVAPISATGNVAVEKETVPVTPQPQPEPEPQPQPETFDCPDGGVRNSEYGTAQCMNDVLACINNGALAGGLNDLFNEDMRNAIVNGMGLCSVQVDKCISSVRLDCKPVYRTMADVWIDFNSRKVQPEYYTFVLRKTGLTPNQAENTCMLLDKNTYGSSFAAVANNGTTTNEYNKNVGAYNNQQGNVLIKTNPLGAQVNDGNPGVDGQRGHYARWDATTATCYLRVAAYNKDEQIKNSWLFGALGDDRLAEVWRPAGDTFSCNKDLFGFSLLNDTSTAAVVGVGGGTVLGAGIGAIAGHGARAFDCGKDLKDLEKDIQKNWSDVAILNEYLPDDKNITITELKKGQCEAIVDLYERYSSAKPQRKVKLNYGNQYFGCKYKIAEDSGIKFADNQEWNAVCRKSGNVDTMQCIAKLEAEYTGLKLDPAGTVCETITGCEVPSLRSTDQETACDNVGAECISCEELDVQIKALDKVFAKLNVLNTESNMGRSIATGAAIGAGAGGVATAITAFVERSNISCRVGDGLNTVAFGKSHSIDSLKDFYVKWNLRLPDTVSPTSTVVDCKTWKSACAQYTDVNQCKNVALNYKPKTNGTTTLVRSACVDSGSICIENEAVAKSYGACK